MHNRVATFLPDHSYYDTTLHHFNTWNDVRLALCLRVEIGGLRHLVALLLPLVDGDGDRPAFDETPKPRSLSNN